MIYLIRLGEDNKRVLCGEENGIADFRSHVTEEIKYGDKFVVTIDENITNISISYVKGLFSDILKIVDKCEFSQFVTIHSPRSLSKTIITYVHL